MSLLPLLFDVSDDFYDPWTSSYLDPHFAVTIHPKDLRTVLKVPKRTQPCSKYCCKLDKKTDVEKKSSAIVSDKDGFQLSLDVQQFAPNEISVKTVDNFIVVEGKHEEREDEHGFIYRHLIRRYQLPESCDLKEVVSTLSSDGVLTIKAPPIQKAIENKERIIQIQQTGPAHLNIKDVKNNAKDDKAIEDKMTE